VYEAHADRIGGRCWSARDFADGQVAEHGGEFLDSRHTHMLALAARFGLTVEDLHEGPAPGRERLWLDGARHRRKEMSEDRKIFLRRLARDARRVGPYRYDRHTQAAVEFDALSVRDWVVDNVPGGESGLMGRLVMAEMACDFGLDTERLSALNLFYEYVEDVPGADERYHIGGGNDQVVHGLAEGLAPGAIHMDAPLQALWSRSDGAYGLRFGGVRDEVIADHVALCLPFTALRRVDLSVLSLGSKKRSCIDDLGMATNAKVLLQFDQRPHQYGSWSGDFTSDRPTFLTWDSTLRQSGDPSVITMFLGGRSGGDGLDVPAPHGPAPEEVVGDALGWLDRGGATALPGLIEGFNGWAWVDHWASDPWVQGSYAAYLPGQYTRYYGFVGKPEGRVHFGGEHTATSNQGYLEGAVRSGERCAREILHAAYS
jgi:monoamine oxidase